MRLNLNALLIVCAMTWAITSIAAEPPAAPPAAAPARTSDYATTLSRELKPTRVIPYKTVGNRPLEMHVFEPEGHQATDRRPCFLAIHGGGWTAGTPTIMYCVTDYLAKRGWVAVSIRYRLHKPDDGTTVWDGVQDGRSAVRYLRAHAGELGIDPDKIVAGGRSAGGHISVATALYENINDANDDTGVSAVPNALVLFSPVIDTSAEGYGHELLGPRWRELSPRHTVRANMPPTIVFHGRRDSTTPFLGAEAFHQAMLSAGNTCQLVPHDRGSHSYMMRTEEIFLETMQQATQFLGQHGFGATADQ